MGRKTFCQLPVLLGCLVYPGAYHDYSLMGVIQQIFEDQLLKVAFPCRLLKKIKGLLVFQMQHRVPAIQPAVHGPQAVHKPFGGGTIVGFPVTELIIIQSGQKAPFINALVSKPAQGTLDNCQELPFLLPVGIFGNHGKIGLEDPAVIPAQDILPDSGINQCLFQRRARGVDQGVFQNLKSHIQLRIQIRPNHRVHGQIGPVGRAFLLCDRIGDFPFHRAVKCLLHGNGRIHIAILPVIPAQIFLIQPCKLLHHVHVPIQIDIAVGRMVIIPVELNKLFISQVGNHGRVPA